MATKKRTDETNKAGDQPVEKAPGVEGEVPNKPVDPEVANEEAVGGPEPIEVTEADNPSPGRNAVPVSADTDDDPSKVPGTNVEQPRAPKRGDSTL